MNRFVVIDLETTGHSPAKGDKIIEVGIVVIENDQITDEFSTFLHPEKKIPSFISQLTAIHDSDLEDAPSFSEMASKITGYFDESYLIAHNVPFDLGFLNQELLAIGLPALKTPVLDTVELSRILFPQAPSFKLGQIAQYLDISHHHPHRAVSDAYVTAKLFLKLKSKLFSLPFETINHLMKLERVFKSDLSKLLEQRQEELLFSVESSQFDSYHGLALKNIPLDEDTQKGTAVGRFGEFLDDIYGEKLQRNMAHFEARPGQREMSETIYDAFQANHHAMIEADTGTGKSLAYILPAVYEAVSENKRIIISTYTTQLQSQLLEEEFPLVEKIVPLSFRVALLKGKQHYISLERLEAELETNEYNYDIALTKAMIVVWLTETLTGDIDELHLPASGKLFARKVAADTEGKLDPSSVWFKRSFYQRARKKALQADIIITNHALLCTDMFHQYQYLPSYDKVIIDEAHHFEETASKRYGLKLDYVHMLYALNQIGSSTSDSWLGQVLYDYAEMTDTALLQRWDDHFEKAKHEIDDLFRLLFQYVLEKNKYDQSLSDIGRIQYRLQAADETETKWKRIKEMVNRLSTLLHELCNDLVSLQQIDLDGQTETQLQNHKSILESFYDNLQELFLKTDDTSVVKWVEIEAKGAKNAVYMYSEPIDMSQLLSKEFFEVKHSIILTSATLTMNNSFSFMKKRLGIPENRLESKMIPSPFSYKDQVQLLIPNDFPDIRYGNQDAFIEASTEAILSLAEITSGRMLVLFTSYDMLKKAYYLLRDAIVDQAYMLIAQGITSGSRSRLKKNFQSFDKAILLGTSSFWEGVDIPGEDLSCLVIVRLPFEAPGHPLFEAKSEKLKQEGKNAFFDLSLPNAVIRFKQGFGRLIRTQHDRGIVFVCDARIMKSRYGTFFTKSIPEVSTYYDTTTKVLEKARQWF